MALVDAAIAGALNDASRMINNTVAPIESRLGIAETTLVGLPQTQQAVAALALDVNTLLAHAANVTSCAAGGNIHTGNGTCVDPVPQCQPPVAPQNGAVALSSHYIIPGTTATYTCSGTNTFVAGPTVRTCNASTQQFNGVAPQCLVCGVVNCLQCVNAVNNCIRCATGHDLSSDGSQCVVRSNTAVLFGGQRAGSRHNFNNVQVLQPNAATFTVWVLHIRI